MSLNSNISSRQSNALNADVLSPLSIMLHSSPSLPSNISYYQSPQSISAPSKSNSSDYLNQPSSGNEFNYCNIQNVSYNNAEQCETPKMPVNVEQNKEPAGIKTVGENDNNNIQSQTTKEQTKNTFSKCSKNNNDIKIMPLIQNIVSTAHLCCDLNLKQIALQVENTQYNPLKFSGLIMRIKDPKTTALIFSNGKIICLGAKTEEDSKNACRKYAKIIKNLNYPVIFKNFTIQNIVGSCEAHFKIDLRNLYNYMVIYDRTVYYETELFPGLIYHYLDKNIENGEPKANIVFLIFKSGKMVITGAKKREQIYNSFNKIFPVLNKFKDKA